ncbi:MAG: rubrerythrin family protein [Desulfobulbaceae bacterium]|nr:rubrerythrin family protein [Desulfobulbaceae bacterium]
MRKNSYRLQFALITAFIFVMTVMSPALSSASDDDKTSKTLKDLQAAFNGESNAHAKYLAYSKKAEEEGYLKVAALFRSAAAAEEIHFKNHAKVIKSMGASPKAEIKLPKIKATTDNLADAIEGETYEETVMYPEFLEHARKENNNDAKRSFTYAKNAEAEHAKLYKKALTNLDNWKVADAGFSVCPTCGYTVEGTPTFSNCPVCATQGKTFTLIN